MATDAPAPSETTQDSAPESSAQVPSVAPTQAATTSAQGGPSHGQDVSPSASSTSPLTPDVSSRAEGSSTVHEDSQLRSPAASDILGQELPGESVPAPPEKAKSISSRESTPEGELKQKYSRVRSGLEPASAPLAGHHRTPSLLSQVHTPSSSAAAKNSSPAAVYIPQPSPQLLRGAGQGGLAPKSLPGKHAPVQTAEVNGFLRKNATGVSSFTRSTARENSVGGGGSPAKPGIPLNSTNVKTSLWHQLLHEARSAKTPEKPKGYIIVLGSQDAGKSAVLRQLQTLGNSKPLTPLETYTNTGGVSLVDYAFFGDRMLADPDDIHTVDAQDYVDVYILQNADMADHLAKRLPPAAVKSLCFLICLDVQQAWCAMDELERWKNVAERIANHLMSQTDIEEQDALIERTHRYLSNYRKGFLSTGLTRAATMMLELQQLGSSLSPSHKAEELPKGETTATALPQQPGAMEGDSSSSAAAAGGAKNTLLLPVPAVVCLTRSDHFAALKSSSTRAEEADVIIAYLRRACLSFNAALIACSCKDPTEPKNLFLLYRYLLHRLYNYAFKEPPYLKDAEVLFMPSGCDTSEAIEEAVRRTIAGNFEKPYEEWITRTVEPMAKMGEVPGGRVVVQTAREFLREMQEQHPSAVMTAAKALKYHQPAAGATVAFDASATSSAEGLSRQDSSRQRSSGSSGSVRPSITIHATPARFSVSSAAGSSAALLQHEASAAAGGGGGEAAAAASARAAAAAAGGAAAVSLRTLSSSSSSGKGGRAAAAADARGSSRSQIAATAKSKPRITVSSSDRAASSQTLSPSSPSTTTALLQQQQPSAEGDSPSLQNFFQGLLAKSKAKASPTARERSRARSKAQPSTAAPSLKTEGAEKPSSPANDA